MLALYKGRHKYKKTNRKRNKNTMFKPETVLRNCAVFLMNQIRNVYLIPIFCKKLQTTTPTATEIFKECLVPS